LVIPAQFEYALSFSEGLAPVVMNGKLGFIDKNGDDSMFSFGIPEIMVIVVVVGAISLVIFGMRLAKNLFKKNEN